MGEKADCLELYLKDIGDIPSLTPEEEIKLAKRVQKGDHKAKSELIRSHLRLVVMIARKYKHLGMAFLDLIEEGNMGLMRAAEKFDPSHECKFSTYAAWWIKQRIMRALSNQSKMIRIPAYMVDRILLVRRVYNKLKNEFSEEPNYELLAKQTGLTLEQVKETFEYSKGTTSLSMPVGDDGGTELIDLIEDSDTEHPASKIEMSMIRDQIVDLLEELNDREVKLIVYRFGLFNNKAHTLEEIGKVMSITRERVRQLEKVAIGKMRKALEEKKHSFEDYHG